VTTRERTQAQLLVVAEVTLASMSVAAVLALRRVFRDGSFVPPTIVAILTAHAFVAALRRRKVAHVVAGAVTAVVALLFVTWVRLRATTAFGFLPTTETLSVTRMQVRQAMDVFREVTPPAPVLPGFVLLACAGAWVVAFAADTAAFRARAHLEAIIPASTLFIFGGALGRGGNRLGVAALFIAATMLHWLAQRSLAATTAPAWLASERGAGAQSLLRLGAGLVAFGVLAAVVVGPHLPGAHAGAIVPWRASDRKAPDSRVTVSPLVSLKPQILDQPNVEVFRVKATQRAYWRLTSLEHFDGTQWTSSREYEPAIGRLGNDVDTRSARSQTMSATFTITALAQFWLPAPFRPVHLSGTKARYDSDSNTLLTEKATATGQSYTVTAEVPVLTAAALETVRPVAPTAIADEYTVLPPGFSIAVQQLAGRVARGASTQYEKAMALQNFFRGGAFTYDLNVPAGHDQNALERFLFVTRRGYCEQFAGAYAAMARAVGLPARIAVGFTPGELDRKSGEYVVRGFNGHAWPEVFLDGYGWVAFEPTPGRGMPGAQGYTNVPEAQAQAGDPSTATTVAPATPAPTGGAETTTTAAAASPGTTTGPTAVDRPGSTWVGRLVMVLAVLVAVPLCWITALAGLRRRRRRRRRKAATTPDARVLVAWNETTEALARAGAPPNPWETPNEFAVRAAGTTGVDRRRLLGLAGLTTQVVYGAVDVAADVADQATGVAKELEAEAEALLDGRARLRMLVDPRPLLPARKAHVDVHTS
jgi:transglutaminase-like putative cysteine protease